jgi:hypothetical protein
MYDIHKRVSDVICEGLFSRMAQQSMTLLECVHSIISTKGSKTPRQPGAHHQSSRSPGEATCSRVCRKLPVAQNHQSYLSAEDINLHMLKLTQCTKLLVNISEIVPAGRHVARVYMSRTLLLAGVCLNLLPKAQYQSLEGFFTLGGALPRR